MHCTTPSGSRFAAAEGVGERRKKDAVRPFFKRYPTKQGVCRAEQAQARADDYATGEGNEKSHPRNQVKPKLIHQNQFGFLIFIFIYHSFKGRISVEFCFLKISVFCMSPFLLFKVFLLFMKRLTLGRNYDTINVLIFLVDG